MAEVFVIEPFGRVPRWAVNRPKDSYFAFFENEFGDRWVLVADGAGVRLSGSETGWDVVHEIRPTLEDLDRFESFDSRWPREAVMNRDERLWLAAALSSAVPGLRVSLDKSLLPTRGGNPPAV